MAKLAKKPRPKKQTKSGAVRAYLAKNPAAGPTEVSKALKKRGIIVSPAHVSNVRQQDKQGRQNGLGRSVTRAVEASDSVSLARLVEARRFAESVGGVSPAITLLESLQKVLS